MRRQPFLATLLLLAAAPAALAQEVDCGNAMAQQELNQCAYQDWQAQDETLNEAYAAAMDLLRSWDANLPEEERGAEQLMIEGQRAWIIFRDQTCAAEGYAMHGGSAEPLLVYSCKTSLTEARATQLNQIVESYSDF